MQMDQVVKFRNGVIGLVFGLIWSIITIYSITVQNGGTKIWKMINYLPGVCIDWMLDSLVSLGVFSSHDWISALFFIAIFGATTGFIIGLLFPVFIGFSLDYLQQKSWGRNKEKEKR